MQPIARGTDIKRTQRAPTPVRHPRAVRVCVGANRRVAVTGLPAQDVCDRCVTVSAMTRTAARATSTRRALRSGSAAVSSRCGFACLPDGAGAPTILSIARTTSSPEVVEAL